MRQFYLLINLLLIAVIAALAAAVFRFRETPRDKVLDWKPPESAIREVEKKIILPVRISEIKNKNIFSPTRGDEGEKRSGDESRKPAPPRLELIGTCTIGESAGAIIETKNANPSEPQGNRKRRYYALGDEVQGGFRLDQVSDDAVTLTRRNETMELKVDRSRFSAEIGQNKKGPQPPSEGKPAPRHLPEDPAGPRQQPGLRGPGTPLPGVNPQNNGN